MYTVYLTRIWGFSSLLFWRWFDVKISVHVVLTYLSFPRIIARLYNSDHSDLDIPFPTFPNSRFDTLLRSRVPRPPLKKNSFLSLAPLVHAVSNGSDPPPPRTYIWNQKGGGGAITHDADLRHVIENLFSITIAFMFKAMYSTLKSRGGGGGGAQKMLFILSISLKKTIANN